MIRREIKGEKGKKVKRQEKRGEKQLGKFIQNL